jgi:hypothetical protein
MSEKDEYDLYWEDNNPSSEKEFDWTHPSVSFLKAWLNN